MTQVLNTSLCSQYVNFRLFLSGLFMSSLLLSQILLSSVHVTVTCTATCGRAYQHEVADRSPALSNWEIVA
jgi:hypothetical protein